MSTATEINLHALAADVLEDTVSPDPGVMAQEFVMRIPADQYREALLLLARAYMREVLRARRQSQNGGSPNATGSRKVAAAREAWKRLLDTPEFVPSSGWVFLRDANVQHVREMAGMRRSKSAELRAAAARYDRLADRMEAAKAQRVGDLPDDTLSQLLDAEVTQ